VARETRLTDSRSPALESAGLVTPQVVHYPSGDGTIITAFLYRPTRASAANRRPAIVYPHGGPADSWALVWSLRLQWLVAKGYAVLAPDYRGSTGHGQEFQRALYGAWGRVDTEDILAAADYLAALEWVDGSRLGVYGTSYGAYLAVLALARDPQYRYRCGAAVYGDSDLRRSWAMGDRTGRRPERHMGHPHNEAYRPILIRLPDRSASPDLPRQEDQRVDPRQSEELATNCSATTRPLSTSSSDEGHGILNPDNPATSFPASRGSDWHLM
jgi:dipeptidyl aminopeptidase/acylaminoacyl peptidase